MRRQTTLNQLWQSGTPASRFRACRSRSTSLINRWRPNDRWQKRRPKPGHPRDKSPAAFRDSAAAGLGGQNDAERCQAVIVLQVQPDAPPPATKAQTSNSSPDWWAGISSTGGPGSHRDGADSGSPAGLHYRQLAPANARKPEGCIFDDCQYSLPHQWSLCRRRSDHARRSRGKPLPAQSGQAGGRLLPLRALQEQTLLDGTHNAAGFQASERSQGLSGRSNPRQSSSARRSSSPDCGKAVRHVSIARRAGVVDRWDVP